MGTCSISGFPKEQLMSSELVLYCLQDCRIEVSKVIKLKYEVIKQVFEKQIQPHIQRLLSHNRKAVLAELEEKQQQLHLHSQSCQFSPISPQQFHSFLSLCLAVGFSYYLKTNHLMPLQENREMIIFVNGLDSKSHFIINCDSKWYNYPYRNTCSTKDLVEKFHTFTVSCNFVTYVSDCYTYASNEITKQYIREHGNKILYRPCSALLATQLQPNLTKKFSPPLHMGFMKSATLPRKQRQEYVSYQVSLWLLDDYFSKHPTLLQLNQSERESSITLVIKRMAKHKLPKFNFTVRINRNDRRMIKQREQQQSKIRQIISSIATEMSVKAVEQKSSMLPPPVLVPRQAFIASSTLTTYDRATTQTTTSNSSMYPLSDSKSHLKSSQIIHSDSKLLTERKVTSKRLPTPLNI